MTDTSGELTRRGLIASVAAAVAAVTVTQIGGTLSPLSDLALLSPRRPDLGPQSLPVNRTAAAAGVLRAATDPAYRLRVEGRVRTPLSLGLADLQALPQSDAELAIACVEGWSASAVWSGVALVDLLRMAGASPDSRVRVESLEPVGAFRSSVLDRARTRDPLTVLALRVRGQTLHTEHGYPVRLMAPNRPGVHQTKWVSTVVVL